MTSPVVLFSAGLDSAVLLADAVRRFGGAQPVYVRAGLAWEDTELRVAERFLAVMPKASRIRPLVQLAVGMRDVYPATHWAIRGEAPGFDTPDGDVYLEGRNIVLLSKTAVFAARAGLTTILIGPLAGNPFPDASSQFFDAMTRALALGLGTSIVIEAPFLGLHKADVIKLGTSLGVPLGLTLSCMQPVQEQHCGRCSKCRERRDAFRAAGFDDPAPDAGIPVR
ncbi:MAG: 7-cyano-7-deazaguanine synthase [Acidobacteria bacterium]|nr:7-cyano-7-deazaguanine synthase [Acidobacteriota bacterium]